jgi:glucan phosphoethanolaminetransferase (alkaline phosphatase superfamily)
VISSCSGEVFKKLNFSEQFGFLPIFYSYLFNIVLVLPSFTAAIFLADIQQLMKYFSSVFGFIIMIIVPSLLIYNYRRRFRRSTLTPGKLNRAPLNRNWQLVAIATVGVALFSMIVYGFIFGKNKTCVAE